MFKRIDLPELEDYPFIPSWYRDLMTDCLQELSLRTRAYDSVITQLEKLLNNSKERQIIDFGSGGGGPWIHTLFPRLLMKFPDLKLKLTDLFPNLDAATNIEKAGLTDRVEYISKPVDMTEHLEEIKGTRIMFTCFHHLTHKNARKVLQNVVNAKAAFGIFEVTGRSLKHFLAVLAIPFLVLAVTPFISGKRLQRICFTYLLPIVPLGCLWDGIASNFRTYSAKELQEMLSLLQNSKDYIFELGEFKALGPRMGTYLLGYSKDAETANVQLLP